MEPTNEATDNTKEGEDVSVMTQLFKGLLNEDQEYQSEEDPELDTPQPKDPLEEYLNSKLARDLIESIDPDRWYTDVHFLSSLNRYAYSQQIKEASKWIADRLQEIPNLQVTEQVFTEHGCSHKNIVGVLRGTSSRCILIGGHYDSQSEHVARAAPGAVDNASGAAAVMELARVFAEWDLPLNVCFVLFAGEELGYYGSKAHLEQLKEEEKKSIKLMLNLDMIGWDNPEGNVKEIETFPEYEALARIFERCSEKFCSLPASVSLFAWGSDHIPYLKSGIPAFLTTNKDCCSYPHYHTTRDVVENVSVPVSKDFLVMDAAAMGYFIFKDVDTDQLTQSSN
eukprot:TRINITY_DN6548_c0_g1_i2.p1 TRINITY_DN6548_c0_g1~~TRINITY_DN6548_c0_g1_i2.p1  ORF type:complete len:339 (+),score=96.38 TRINITY_DN6548_c0_g1_i2:26-1042(+)